MPEPQRLGARLLLARTRAGLTQEQLAHQAGVTVATIARLERSHHPQVHSETLTGLARALAVSTDWLLGLTDQPAGRPAERPGETTSQRYSPLQTPAVERLSL